MLLSFWLSLLLSKDISDLGFAADGDAVLDGAPVAFPCSLLLVLMVNMTMLRNVMVMNRLTFAPTTLKERDIPQ